MTIKAAVTVNQRVSTRTLENQQAPAAARMSSRLRQGVKATRVMIRATAITLAKPAVGKGRRANARDRQRNCVLARVNALLTSERRVPLAADDFTGFQSQRI